MVVVYNSDERFSSIFATSVVSLFESNQDVDEITVYLIENGISEESKAKFQEIANTYNRTIITIPMPDLGKLAGVDIAMPAYTRLASCGRLFIASCLPQNIDKVIYADCDIIFLHSLVELWDMDISKYYVGMADDGQSGGHREILGIPADGVYYNSGVMLVNLRRWREEGLEKAFVDYICSQGGYVPYPDQGALNAVLNDHILKLPLKFNVYGILYVFNYEELLKTRRPPYYYSKEEFEQAVNDPVAVHFSICVFMPNNKPWIQGCVHPFKQKYLEYKSKTPWKNEPLWDAKLPLLRQLYYIYFRIVPRPLSIFTSRIIYVYLLPAKHRFNKWVHCKKQRLN